MIIVFMIFISGNKSMDTRLEIKFYSDPSAEF